MWQRSCFKWIYFGVLGSVLLNPMTSQKAAALDLTAPFLMENAQVLPPGARNPRFVNLFMSVEGKFNGSGQADILGRPLYKTVKWSDVIDQQKTDTEKSLVQSTLSDAGVDLNGGPGTTSGQVNTFFNVKVPILAMAFTPKLTMAVAVPIMNIKINADTGFNKSEDGQKWLDQVCNRSVEQCNTAGNRLNNSINEKLKTLGYETIESREISSIGDIQIVGKYQVINNSSDFLTVKSQVILPTGTAPNVNRALDIPTGDGRFQVGASVIYDRWLPYDFRINTFGGLLAYLPHQLEKRIPTGVNESLSKDKELLTRGLAEQINLGASVSHLFATTGIVVGGGYNFQFLSKPSYSGGTAFATERYRFLEDLTPAEVLHSTMLMAGFSSVEWFQNKKFFYPFQANLIYSHPFLGRNVATNNVISGELVLFF